MENLSLLKSNPLEDYYGRYIDLWVWSMLQWYFMPYMLMAKGTEADQWIAQFSTNGIKQFSICR